MIVQAHALHDCTGQADLHGHVARASALCSSGTRATLLLPCTSKSVSRSMSGNDAPQVLPSYGILQGSNPHSRPMHPPFRLLLEHAPDGARDIEALQVDAYLHDVIIMVGMPDVYTIDRAAPTCVAKSGARRPEP